MHNTSLVTVFQNTMTKRKRREREKERNIESKRDIIWSTAGVSQ